MAKTISRDYAFPHEPWVTNHCPSWRFCAPFPRQAEIAIRGFRFSALAAGGLVRFAFPLGGPGPDFSERLWLAWLPVFIEVLLVMLVLFFACVEKPRLCMERHV